MNPLIISRLIESGVEVFLQIGGEERILIKKNNALSGVIACVVAQDENHSPIARVQKMDGEIGFLAACDPVTRSVWLIPVSEVESMQTLRLGKKYDDYIIPEPLSMGWKEQRDQRVAAMSEIKERAKEAMRRARGENNE